MARRRTLHRAVLRVLCALMALGVIGVAVPLVIEAAHGPGPGRAVIHRPLAGAVHFWNRALFGRASPVVNWRGGHKSGRAVDTPPPWIGALFFHDTGGDHFCSASVLDSPHENVIVTAAHCVHTGKNGHFQQDIVFVPGYRDGQSPYGIWQPTTILVDQGWISSSDPNLDVAFLVLAPENGKNIGSITGGNRIAFDVPDPQQVRVTGYPAGSDTPITCTGRASAQGASQQRFACDGYSVGTSGSPWVTHDDSRSRSGRLIGVIGGYQQGGDTPDVSYSPVFGSEVDQLYQQAAAQT